MFVSVPAKQLVVFSVVSRWECRGVCTMKKLLLASVIVGVATLFSMGTAPSAHADEFAFSLNTGDVAFAYSDGYWDRDHRWHNWRNAREHREYRARFHDRYEHRGHKHFKNK